MGGEYSFLEGMSKAANPYLQGAMQEGWRRKREDKATEAAVKSTEESRRFQLNSVLAGTGSAKEGAFADSPYSKELGEINKYKKDIAERERVQEKIDEARKKANHRNKQIQFMFDASRKVKDMATSGESDDTVLPVINQLMGVYREMGYPMEDWKSTDRINFTKKIKSVNNKIIAGITTKVDKCIKDISELSADTIQPGMAINAKVTFALEEIALLEANITDKGTLAILALKKESIKTAAKDAIEKNTKETDRQKRLADAKATENRALENKKKMLAHKAGLPQKPLNINTPKFKKDVVSILKDTKPDEWADASPAKKKMLMLMETINQMKQYHGDSVEINETESGITEFIKDGKVIGRWR